MDGRAPDGGAAPTLSKWRSPPDMNDDQLTKMRAGRGFIAALDQSGGSSPKALAAYGVAESEYSGDAEMFDKIHEMRERIVTSKSFGGDRVVGAILFEDTMNRTFDGSPAATFLWEVKGVLPFLKVDKGLEDEAKGVQMMKPMPELDALLDTAVSKGIFGTKMRSVIKHADAEGIAANVAQQFEVGRQIAAKGLVPILEPEVDINSPTKAEAEELLAAAITENLASLNDDELIMLKLTLPEKDNHYASIVAHPNVVKVVALSGGYTRDDANARLARNTDMIASYSRALTQDLRAQQSDDEFDAELDSAIQEIYDASIAG